MKKKKNGKIYKEKRIKNNKRKKSKKWKNIKKEKKRKKEKKKRFFQGLTRSYLRTPYLLNQSSSSAFLRTLNLQNWG